MEGTKEILMKTQKAQIPQFNQNLEQLSSDDPGKRSNSVKWIQENFGSILLNEDNVDRSLKELEKRIDLEEELEILDAVYETLQDYWEGCIKKFPRILDKKVGAILKMENWGHIEVFLDWVSNSEGMKNASPQVWKTVHDALVQRLMEEHASERIKAMIAALDVIWRGGLGKHYDSIFKRFRDLINTNDWETRQDTVNWVVTNAKDIAAVNSTFLLDMYESLDERLHSDETDSDVLDALQRAILELWNHGLVKHPGLLLTRIKGAYERMTSSQKRRTMNLLKRNAGSLVESTRVMGEVMDWLIDQSNYEDDEDTDQTIAEALGEIDKANQAKWENDWAKNQLLTLKISLLTLDRTNNWEIRASVIKWISNHLEEISRDDRQTVQTIEQLVKVSNENVRDYPEERQSSSDSISRLLRDAVTIIFGHLRTRIQEKSDNKSGSSPNSDRLVTLVIRTFAKTEDPELFIALLDWLGESANLVAHSEYQVYKKVIETLEKFRNETPAEDCRELATITISNIWSRLQEIQLPREKDILNNKYKGNGINITHPDDLENLKTLAIWRLAEKHTLGSRAALRFLVRKWIYWIYYREEPRLIEFAAEAMRKNRYSVLALIEHFQKQEAPEEEEPRVVQNGPSFQFQPRLFDAERQRQEVDRRIVKQLADMSDPAYFDEMVPEFGQIQNARVNHAEILGELERHIVPVFIRYLSGDHHKQDTAEAWDPELEKEIRQEMVRMLGYVGSREAVDALARQVVGQERQRKARQELLDEYYLKPSQKRGEQATEILEGTITESTRTLWILRLLNTAVFMVGLGALVTGLYISINGEVDIQRFIGNFLTLGGLAGMLRTLVRDPLDRIQNAMANLVQIETAFTGFIWELNLNGTFIQSRYVKNGVLKDEEISNTAHRIETAMELTMDMVSTYTEQTDQRVVTRINRITPAAGGPGSALTIYGQHLFGDSSQGKKGTGMVAVNHHLVDSDFIQPNGWFENRVEIQLPGKEELAKLPTTLYDNDTVLISLLIDGIETNAIPFHLQLDTAAD
jgi:hypothetical protein